MSRVVFLLMPELHLLDLAGPAQVFSTAAELGHDYELDYISQHGNVLSAQGLPLRAERDWPDLTADDLVLVPGSRVPDPPRWPRLHSATAQKLRDHHGSGGTIASVCSGADVLGQAKLLDGRRCTTHHDLQDELARRHPATSVVRDVLFVSDGGVVTSAGIASGIDLALHLLAEERGPGEAARVAREMVVYARRNGDEQQASAMLRHRAHLDDAVHRVQDIIDARFTEPLLLSELAAGAGVSERTVTRSFSKATGLTPLRYQQVLRLERADHLIGRGATAESAARAAGFADGRMLHRIRAREAASRS